MHKTCNVPWRYQRLLCACVVLWLMVMGGVSPAAADSKDDVNMYLQEGRLGKWTEDYGRLLTNYEKALELDPANVEAQHALREAREMMRPALKPQMALYHDSEDLSMDSYGSSVALYPRPTTRVNVQYAYTAIEQHDRSVDKHAYQLRVNHRLSHQLAGGFYYEYNDYNRASDSQSFHGDLYYQVTPRTALYGAFTHQHLLDAEDPFSLYGWSTIGDIDAIFQHIHTNDYSASLIQQVTDALRYLGSFTYGDYSDGNRKITTYHEVDWRCWRGQGSWPELHAKYTYFVLDYSKDSAFYWSPGFFNSHAWVFQLKGAAVPRLHWMAESGLSFSPEGTGLGYRVDGTAEFKMTKNWSIEGSAFYFREPQKGRGDYWVRKFTAAISYRF